MVEDSQADADLILRQLRQMPGEFSHVHVASESGLRKALTEFQPDLILSDFSMPGFSGQEALKLAVALAPAVPFLFVSGTIGEELAIDTLQNGAIDYVLKDNLRRLPTAIARALDISRTRRERELMERALRESEERFRMIVESSSDWIWESDIHVRQLYSNSAVFGILGYTPQEILNTHVADLMVKDDHDAFVAHLPSIVAERKGWQNWRQRWWHRDGSVRVLESTGTAKLDDDGNVVGFRGVDRDITKRLEHEEQIRHMARIHAVMGALGHAVLRATTRTALLKRMCEIAVEHGGFMTACISELSEEGDSLQLSHCFGDTAVTSYLATLGDLAIADSEPASLRPILRALIEQKIMIIRSYATDERISGQRRTEMAALGISSKIALPIGNPPWGVMSLYASEPKNFDEEELILLRRLTDEIDYAIDFIKKSERLEFLAYNNAVTGLPNRVSYVARLQSLMLDKPMCVALVDVINFSAINESRGRAFGDMLLKSLANRVRGMILEDTIVAHPEADTFALAYSSLGNAEFEVERFDARMREFCREPFVVNGEEIRIDLRGGLALAPEHGVDAETVEHNALAAMMEGGRRGLHVYLFNEELRGRAARRLQIQSDLRRALDNKEFELHYQPKFDTASHRLVGAEALLRWRHPQRGMILPSEFIPLLEESELIVPVGRRVMREALRVALLWREHIPGFRIAVNVSSRELRHNRFIEECAEILQDHSENQLIDIEVTESLLMDDIDHSMKVLQLLRDLGCEISIDDFGTGYSSLNYLARLPVDMIKIDQSFVSLMTQSPETMSLVSIIINLARSLSLKTVAEGVEEEEQMRLLRLLRCDQIQGYLLGRPMSESDFETTFMTAFHHPA